MKIDFTDAVYLTLIGELSQEYCVPGVENLYAEGAPCDILYRKMREAYERLLDRLGRIDNDPDLDIIVDSLGSISEKTGYAMYRYGSHFSMYKYE